jgi:hypothetical protein
MIQHLRTILWHNRAEPNSDSCSLFQTASEVQLKGSALLIAAGRPARVNYRVVCGLDWATRSVDVETWVGDAADYAALRVDAEGRWWRGADPLAGLDGLIDVDLAFTPATNTLAIRRLNLAEGASGEITAAWVQFPSLAIVPSPQRYTRTGPDRYLFESLRDGFRAELRIDEHGMITDYEGLWQQIAAT